MSQGGVISAQSTQSMVKFTSPTIDFTQTGTTTIFTNGSSEFIPYSFTFVSDAVTNYISDGTFNLGFTATDYNDYVDQTQFGNIAVNEFSSFLIDPPGGNSGFAILPPSTALVLKIVTGVTATVFTGRMFVFGFTV